MIEILAQIPDNNGREIHFSNMDAPFVVTPTTCSVCGYNEATTVIRGETDSTGFEILCLCPPCYNKVVEDDLESSKALDTEDRQGFFWVSECTNNDGHGSWFSTFTSFRAATAFLRKIEDLADRWGGLYPGRGIHEGTEEQMKAAAARIKEANDREREWELEELSQDDFEEEEEVDEDDFE